MHRINKVVYEKKHQTNKDRGSGDGDEPCGAPSAVGTKDDVTGLAEEELLRRMEATLWHPIASLTGKQIEKLVHNEGRRECGGSATRHQNGLSADWTSHSLLIRLEKGGKTKNADE